MAEDRAYLNGQLVMDSRQDLADEAMALGRELERKDAEIDRLRALIDDACDVFDHYDLPEHAFHYRRAAATPSHPEGT